MTEQEAETLYKVLRAGRYKLMCEFMDSGELTADCLLKHQGGFTTPMHVAALNIRGDSIKMVQHLLNAGADVNAVDSEGNTPLFHAVMESDPAMVTLMLGAGAQVNVKNHHGMTPLHEAAAYGALDNVKLLLKAGADATAESKEKETPLHGAAMAGNVEIMQLLVAAGADVNAREIDGLSVLGRAAAYQTSANPILYLISQGADVGGGTHSGNKPLHHAAMRGNTDVMNALLDAGADINMPGVGNVTPLCLAVMKEMIPSVQLLLSRGASCCCNGDSGELLFSLVLKMENAQIIQLMQQQFPPFAKIYADYRRTNLLKKVKWLVAALLGVLGAYIAGVQVGRTACWLLRYLGY